MLHPQAQLNKLISNLEPLQFTLGNHPLYQTFKTIADLHIFMESHVFAVWDFMSLLKSLQNKLTCVNVPWLPSVYKKSRRLINDIVLNEESDQYDNNHMSHFEVYLQAMRECGAATISIENVLSKLSQGHSLQQALSLCNVPEDAKKFVYDTFSIIKDDQLHTIAAAFTFGREDIIPEMFHEFIQNQNDQLQGKLKIFHWYLQRHITIDADEHGPMALEMMIEICGNDEIKWLEAEITANKALQSRIELWNEITAHIKANQKIANLGLPDFKDKK